MEDWEDEPASLVLKKEPASLWDDEDADENDIKDSWEDEDEPAPAPVVAPPPVVKAPKKSTLKPAQEKGKAVAEVAKEVPLDPVAEKLRQQRLVEEADYKNTAELFSSKKGDDKTIDTFIPTSENDFIEYAELISCKLRPFEKSFHYIGLLKHVMRLSTTYLKAADAKEVAASVSAIANEKLKAEKEAAAGRKKTGAKKKKLLQVKSDDEAVTDAGYDGYDNYDDFM